MRKKSIRLEDIAAICNVDKATVSRALNNKKGVSEKKKAEIVRVAMEKGFKPNSFASALAGGLTYSVLVLVQNLELLNNEYYGKLYLNLVKQLREFGYSLVTGIVEDKQSLRIIQQKQVDAVILLNSKKYDETLYECMKTDLAMVAIGSGFQNNSQKTIIRTPTVVIENNTAAKEVYKKLSSIVTGSIHFMFADNIQSFLERLEGCKEAEAEGGNPLTIHLIPKTGYNSREYIKSAEKYMASVENFSTNDAVFCANDDIAIGVYRHFIKEYGYLPCPLIGYDNTYLSELIGNGISSVEQNIEMIASEGVKLLMDAINSETKYENKILSIKPTLVERDSTLSFSQAKEEYTKK